MGIEDRGRNRETPERGRERTSVCLDSFVVTVEIKRPREGDEYRVTQTIFMFITRRNKESPERGREQGQVKGNKSGEINRNKETPERGR